MGSFSHVHAQPEQQQQQYTYPPAHVSQPYANQNTRICTVTLLSRLLASTRSLRTRHTVIPRRPIRLRRIVLRPIMGMGIRRGKGRTWTC
jgi:hypothetical protein